MYNTNKQSKKKPILDLCSQLNGTLINYHAYEKKEELEAVGWAKNFCLTIIYLINESKNDEELRELMTNVFSNKENTSTLNAHITALKNSKDLKELGTKIEETFRNIMPQSQSSEEIPGMRH